MGHEREIYGDRQFDFTVPTPHRPSVLFVGGASYPGMSHIRENERMIFIQGRPHIFPELLKLTCLVAGEPAVSRDLHPMASFLRKLVSQNKQRHVDGNYDLDLTYLTDQIICMGLPATGPESLYRNPIEQVVKFLEERHAGRYKVFNLCIERTYDISLFGDACACFPFDDHCAPPLSLVHAFCASAKSWLLGGMDNVVCIHCKAGKGRTGLMASSLLLHLGFHKTASDAIAFYDGRRTRDGKGLTVPSQRRYVGYYERALAGEVHDGELRVLEGVTMLNAPARRPTLILKFLNHGAPNPGPPLRVTLATARGAPNGALREARCSWPVRADLKVDIIDGENGSVLARVCFHPSFEPAEASFVLARDKTRSQIDLVEKGSLPDNFRVVMQFGAATASMGATGATAAAEAEASSSPATEPSNREPSKCVVGSTRSSCAMRPDDALSRGEVVGARTAADGLARTASDELGSSSNDGVAELRSLGDSEPEAEQLTAAERVHEAEAPCEALIAIGTASATGPPVVDPLAGMAIESTITTSEEVDRMLDLTESETYSAL